MHSLAWFPSFSCPKPDLGNIFYCLGLLLLCGPATGFVVAVRDIAPLVPPITTGNCRSFFAECQSPNIQRGCYAAYPK
jgi:hypothetical protein